MIQYFPIVTGSLVVLGNVSVSGSINASGSVTISGSIASASFASTASFVTLSQTASFVANAQSASNAVNAATASSADNFLTRGTLTAQTLVVQTITSSIDYVTGSTRFGSLSSDTHVFTGSMYVTGALYVPTGSVGIGSVTPTALFNMKAVVTGSSSLIYLENAPVYSTSSVRMWFDNLDTFFISKGGGTDRIGFALANGGNVGIGITNPSYKLHVYNPNSASYFDGGTTDTSFYISHGSSTPPGSQAIAGIRTNTGSPVINAKNGGTIFFNRDVNAANIEFQYSTGSATSLFVSSSGNVSIGTTSPRALLHLRGSGTSGQVTATQIWENLSSGTLGLEISGSAGSSYAVFKYGGGPGTGTATLTQAMAIVLEGAGAGRVGIGTTSAEGVLTIKGTSAQPLNSGTTANSLLQIVGSLNTELNIGSNTVAGNYGAYLQVNDNNLAVTYPLNLQPNGGTVSIGTYSTGTEANLHLGANGASEGGQLILQKATSYASASHLDNYQNYFRVMSGNDTTSALVRMQVDMTNGATTIYGSLLDIISPSSPTTIRFASDGTYTSITRDYIATTSTTLDITTERTDGGGFNFLVIASSTLVASGANWNKYMWAVLGRGTTATATQLANNSGGTASRTAMSVSFPSNGVIRLTLTGGESCQVKATIIGHGAL